MLKIRWLDLMALGLTGLLVVAASLALLTGGLLGLIPVLLTVYPAWLAGMIWRAHRYGEPLF